MTVHLSVGRPQLLDMADNPEGYPLQSEQALLVVCSTQVWHAPDSPADAQELPQAYYHATGFLEDYAPRIAGDF